MTWRATFCVLAAALVSSMACMDLDDAYRRCLESGRCTADAGVEDANTVPPGGASDAGVDGGPEEIGVDAGTSLDGGCVPRPIQTSCAAAWCEVYSTPDAGQTLDAVFGFSSTAMA